MTASSTRLGFATETGLLEISFVRFPRGIILVLLLGAVTAAATATAATKGPALGTAPAITAAALPSLRAGTAKLHCTAGVAACSSQLLPPPPLSSPSPSPHLSSPGQIVNLSLAHLPPSSTHPSSDTPSPILNPPPRRRPSFVARPADCDCLVSTPTRFAVVASSSPSRRRRFDDARRHDEFARC